MSSDKIPYTKISLFSKLVQDYLVQNERLDPFYNRHNAIENFMPQISEKEKQDIDRSLLVEVLNEQYKGIELSEDTENNISSLSSIFFDLSKLSIKFKVSLASEKPP